MIKYKYATNVWKLPVVRVETAANYGHMGSSKAWNSI